MNLTTDLPAFLRPPRVPQRAPVSVVTAKATVTRGGYPHRRAAFIVSDHDGYLVEVLSGDADEVERQFFARWPWFSTHGAPRFGIIGQTWPLAVNVSPAEYKRLAGLEPWSENSVKLRKLADRCECYSAVRQAINDLHVNGSGTVREYGEDTGEPRYAVIYHRTRKHGGDAASEEVRRAMRWLVEHGMAERLDTGEYMPNGKTRQADYVGQYRATDTTPEYA